MRTPRHGSAASDDWLELFSAQVRLLCETVLGTDDRVPRLVAPPE
jgi:hypothetical protein